MSTLTRIGALGGASALVATGLVVLASPAEANHVFVIRVDERQTDYDDDFSGMPEKGDRFAWKANLRQNGKRVGTDRGECEFVRFIGNRRDPSAAVLECKVKYRFFDTGSVTARGKVRIDWDDLVDSDFTARLPVRDGTGKFEDAGGYVRNTQIDENDAKLYFRLTRVKH
ncbi:hypothetical protein [Sporichthya polymorpha]|uniref:hypothetical protein n=1 Tax=Sporichthya polymorpha TaxID=35751 RepID=UPI00037BC7F0|nr:hypothetical protein [Sporichthya polymorpha]